MADGAGFVPRLFDRLGSHRVTIRSVTVTRPSLDDVFLAHTGTTIRDAEAGAEHASHGDADEGTLMTTTMTPEAVRVPVSSLATEARAAAVVWQREMIRFVKDRARILSSLAQPLLFLFVLGTGLGSLLGQQRGRRVRRVHDVPVPGRPGDLGAVHRGLRGHLDRLGPGVRLPARDARRAGVDGLDPASARRLGGATVATLQCLVLLALAGLVGVPYDPLMLLAMVGLIFLMGFMITSLGLLLAARVQADPDGDAAGAARHHAR